MNKRSEKISSSLEDYLEAIYNLSSGNNVARSKDIAGLLGVSQSSVTGALRSLSDKGLINYKPYGYITLTGKGQKAASWIARKHGIIKSFFVDILGVDPEVAQQAACRAEHAFGGEVITRLVHFIEFSAQSAKNGDDIISRFKDFSKRIDEGEISVSADEFDGLVGERSLRTLDKVSAGSIVHLAKIEGERGVKHRLAAMGVLPDEEILVLINEHCGQVVLNVKNSRVVVGRGMARKLLVY